jgi:dinuclear metal center YbgI/SA1388 family protein
MKIADIVNYLETIAPLVLQESYDNAGLITGNKNDDITGILICLDCIETVVEEARKLNCNLIIAHHPIIFGGLKKITDDNYVSRTIINALKNDIAIYAIHTNLDNLQQGVNSKIAENLGLHNCKVLSPRKGILKKLVTFAPQKSAAHVRQALFDAGAGHIGNYDHCSYNLEGTGTFRGNESANPYVGEKAVEHHEAEVRIEAIYPVWIEKQLLKSLFQQHPYEEVAYDIYSLDNHHQSIGAGLIGTTPLPIDELVFLQFMKEKMRAACVRYTPLRNKPVQIVAVCGGSGSFLLKDAIAAGADVLVSADFKYHQFFDADNKIIIADIGHYESEQFTSELVRDLLQKKFSTFAPSHKIVVSKINTNPINYL